MRRMCLAIVLLPLLLQYCATADAEPARIEYTIDKDASHVDIVVRSDGPLAHDHVFTVSSIDGLVWLGNTSMELGFDLSFPVDELVADDPQARAAAGEFAPSRIARAERNAVRRTMLGPRVLDSRRFPVIKLKSLRMTGNVQDPQLSVLVTIRDISREVALAPSVVVAGPRLIASGQFEIRQSDFGIHPLSVALGAVRIEDRLRVKFVLAADEKSPAGENSFK